MKSINDDEMEIAVRLLLRIFQLEPRCIGLFDLPDIPSSELRHHPIFVRHVKVSGHCVTLRIRGFCNVIN